jgi:hypothetical protein
MVVALVAGCRWGFRSISLVGGAGGRGQTEFAARSGRWPDASLDYSEYIIAYQDPGFLISVVE